MKISTRGRYALRVMIDLAEQNLDAYIPLKEVAERQEISRKYLESIAQVLSKAGLIEGAHGKGGGYKLTRSPADYTVAEILRLTEGSLAPVACLEGATTECLRADSCRTLPMWTEFERLVNDYFEGITVADLAKTSMPFNYVI